VWRRLRLIQILQILEPFLLVKRTGGLSIYFHVFAFYRCIQNGGEICDLPLLDDYFLLIVDSAVLRLPQQLLGTSFLLLGSLPIFTLSQVIWTLWLFVSAANTFFIYLARLFEIDQVVQVHEFVVFDRYTARYRIEILEVSHVIVLKLILFDQFFSSERLLFYLFFTRRLSFGIY